MLSCSCPATSYLGSGPRLSCVRHHPASSEDLLRRLGASTHGHLQKWLHSFVIAQKISGQNRSITLFPRHMYTSSAENWYHGDLCEETVLYAFEFFNWTAILFPTSKARITFRIWLIGEAPCTWRQSSSQRIHRSVPGALTENAKQSYIPDVAVTKLVIRQRVTSVILLIS